MAQALEIGKTFKARHGRNPEVVYTILRKTAQRVVYGWSLNDAQWTIAASTFNRDYEAT